MVHLAIRLTCGSTPVIRSAASRPDISAVGTPTPGTVDEPASTTLSMPRTVLAGRNGPVWPNVCASANGVPAAMPCRAQSAGVDDVQQFGVVAELGQPRR